MAITIEQNKYLIPKREDSDILKLTIKYTRQLSLSTTVLRPTLYSHLRTVAYFVVAVRVYAHASNVHGVRVAVANAATPLFKLCPAPLKLMVPVSHT